jgi:ATP-dependent helicase/DNAse subunit B
LPVKILISPPATGKTQTCIQRIRDIQSSEPLARIWVLVPDSQNIAYFKQRQAVSGGGVGVNITTFSTLFTEILEKHGVHTPVITPALEHRLVQETVDQAFSDSSLAHYEAIRKKPGFISALQDIFSELRAGFVSPQQFYDYTKDRGQSSSELGMLYSQFIARLDELKWIDRDGQIWQAIEIMDNNPRALSDIKLVLVDGFTGFASARLRFLKSLSQQAGEMLITLPGEPGSNRAVHRRATAEIEKLKETLNPEIVQTASKSYLFNESRHLEKHLLEPGDIPVLKPSPPLMIEATSQSEEVREALRWIKELNKRHALPLQACALFVGDFAAYRPLLRSAAHEFGIPIRFSHPEPLMDSPAIQTLINLLALPGENYQTRLLLNALRSPYFDFGLEDHEIEALEALSQHARIIMGRDQWKEAWELLLHREEQALEDRPDEYSYKNPLEGVDIHALQARFSHFWSLFDAINQHHSQKAWITWLEALLVRLNFYDQIESERDQEACAALAEALKALIMSENVAGTRSVDYATFTADLQGTLQGARLDEPREGRSNSLLIGKITEARASRFEAVALLGFSEGIFPAVENPDPFLDEQLRMALGLEPRLNREQASTFYQAFTRADTHLLMTRPYLSEDGEKWESSPYWESTLKCFDDSALQTINQNAVRPQSEAASPQEVLFWAVQQNNLDYPQDADLSLRWKELQHARVILNARRSKRSLSLYEGEIPGISGVLSERFGLNRPWSASRFETYGTCPFQFFVQYVLELEPKEPPELGLNARQLGSILHRVLELAYREAGPGAEKEKIIEMLEVICEPVFEKAPRKYGFRPSYLWEVEQSQFKELLRKTIDELEAQSKDWTPIGFEQKFGIGHQPALTIKVGAEMVQLRGLIDRIDRHTSGSIRVIDYKTGGSHLDKRSFEDGRRLQLPIYGLAAQDALGLGEVVDGFYWIIRKADKSSFKLSKYKTEDDEGLPAAKRVTLEHLQISLSGIRSGHFKPKAPHDGCPSYCPAVQWCWRYEAGW